MVFMDNKQIDEFADRNLQKEEEPQEDVDAVRKEQAEYDMYLESIHRTTL